MSIMKDRDWRTLVHNIRLGNCILVLGPDLARDRVGGELRPLTQILANRFADELEDQEEVFNRDHLVQCAQLYADLTSENDLCLEAATFYESRRSPPSAVYADLAALPFRLTVNATPDVYLIHALEEAGKEFVVDFYNYRGKARDMVNWEPKDKTLVYYLYGSSKVPESLVISERHLLDFLVAVISNDPPIQRNVVSEFRDKEKPFLFLGFGFRNWYLRILLYVLLGGKSGTHGKTSRSFALEELVPADASEFQNICFLFKDDLRMDFSDMPMDEFVSELRRRYEEHVRDDTGTEHEETETEIADDSPAVFVCHASEDKPTAMSLCERLRAGGLKPWIDKEGIQGGDEWDRLIKRQIEKSDYFMILQSKAMVSKTVGYVNKEIHFARERQREFRSGIKFILPVRIEECDLLEDLRDIQTVDCTGPDSTNDIIKIIHRDQERRKR